MIDRDRELAFLTGLFSRAARGAGNAAMVTGPLASGKTELLRRLRVRAEACGATVLTGGPDHVEAGLRLAGRTPVLVCVDDVQRANAESLRSLPALAGRVSAARICVVLAETERPGRPLTAAGSGLPHAHHLRLKPLTKQDIARVLGSRFGPIACRRLAGELHAMSGGIPMLVGALTQDYLAGPGSGRIVAGRAFHSATSAFLRRAEPDEIAVAQMLAVLGRHGSADLAARCLRMDKAAALDCVRTLSTAGLLDADRYRHRAARFAVLRGLSAAERRRHYLGVATALSVRARCRPSDSLVADLSYALSEAELRVASLAALGYSNREIAGELRITVSTVEQHLTRTYRKLDVGGRGELAGRLLVETLDGRPPGSGQ